MGRKKKTRRSKKQVKTIGNDMLGGFLVVFGLMYFVFLFFYNIGTFAEFIKNLSYGLFGNAIYILPVTLIIVGCYAIASEKKIKVGNQILKGVLVMSLISPIIYTFSSTNFDLFNNFIKYCVEAYNSGIAGVVGAVIAGISVKFIGILATRILLIAITFIALLCIFNLSYPNVSGTQGKAQIYKI